MIIGTINITRDKIFAVFAPAHAAPLLISTEQMPGVLMVATVASWNLG